MDSVAALAAEFGPILGISILALGVAWWLFVALPQWVKAKRDGRT